MFTKEPPLPLRFARILRSGKGSRRRRSPEAHLEFLETRIVPATLPPNFSEAIVASGLSSATALEFSPEGKLFIAEQGGTLEVWQDGSRLQANFFQNTPLSTQTVSERGLLGLAFDPNYASNRYIYVYYTTTASDNHNRISRFTANATGDLALAGSESILMELDPHSAGNHNGGAIHFGPDGKLYVAVGDNAAGANSQSLANRHGKMLRINPDGSIPADNPTSFPGITGTTTGANRAIWAVGLRNPFTFAFQPGTGRMHINDVGQGTWEEINVATAGANFGWPTTEGDFNQATYPNFTKPLYAYSHGSGPFQGYSIAGGAFYDPASPGINRFPTSYDGDYFFADYVNDWINVIDLNTKAVSQFATGALGMVDLRVADDGSLFYLARDQGRVYRVTYTANQAPAITQQPQNQTVSTGTSATFTVIASGSSPLSYQWQRADAGTSNWTAIASANASSYTLANAGASDNGDRFRVIVSNPFGTQTSTAATLTVTANQAPSVTITVTSGLTGGKFIAGQPITFSGMASDPEDGTLNASNFTWRVDYITSIDSGNPAVRPFVPEFGGQTTGAFTPATTGPYTLTDVSYRVVATVTDSAGQSTTVTRDIDPNVANLTITTSPSGLQVTVDGQPFTAPHSFASVVGFERPIGTATTQTLAGATYNFTSWSDAGAATHTISTPATDTTYTATFSAASGFAARVNFQTDSSPGYTGYVADTGAVFANRGNGYTYGWNANNSSTARNRDAANSPDERYDTFQHLQKPENPNAVWELAVPNGTYSVHLVAGDPSFTDSVFRLNVEGVLAVSGTPSASNHWIEGTVTVTVSDGRLTVSNGSGASNNKISFLEVQAASGPIAFQQNPGATGLVSMEAENADANVTQGGKSWTTYTATTGYSGVSAMWTTPNTGVNNDTGYVANSPRLDFVVNFVKTGIHYVWIRGRGPNGNDDSVHVGLDGAAVSTADRISSFPSSGYGWTRSTMDNVVATINVTSTGIHTVNLWMREDGTIVDKVLLTTSSSYTPTGTGPAQSPRGGTASVAAVGFAPGIQTSSPSTIKAGSRAARLLALRQHRSAASLKQRQIKAPLTPLRLAQAETPVFGQPGKPWMRRWLLARHLPS